MVIKDFIWFIEEREKLRLQKEAGLPLNCIDPILSKTHFLNIHSIHDPGTIRLHQFIHCMTEWEKLFYIFIYRTCFSNPKTLKQMTGVWMHDYRNMKLLGTGIHSDYQPYYLHIGKHNSLDHFLLHISLPVLKLFWQSFDRYIDEEIEDVEEELSVLFSLHTGRNRMRLLSSIIIKDLALQFPGRVNPDSKCNLSITARQALKKLPDGRSKSNVERLRHSTGLNYSSLNSALELWYQYQQRKKFYEERGYLREEWLIKTL